MTISAGSRLGPYEVLSPLGADGMGEVYRARENASRRSITLQRTRSASLRTLLSRKLLCGQPQIEKLEWENI